VRRHGAVTASPQFSRRRKIDRASSHEIGVAGIWRRKTVCPSSHVNTDEKGGHNSRINKSRDRKPGRPGGTTAPCRAVLYEGRNPAQVEEADGPHDELKRAENPRLG